MNRARPVLLCLALAALLAGTACGQKGDLTRPPPPEAPAEDDARR
ncbi:hypothetical protein [Coralloluteibacterium thermophilus]|uniref:Lipoprotein n=1 Tax=Coralloluteibacterium thermophilum TaxID=2707049 RepID=A0ABV9NML6_9GAMM